MVVPFRQSDVVCHFSTPFRVFPTSSRRWSFSGVCVTANFLKFLGLISVFWLILLILSSGCSPLVLLFSRFQVPLIILWRLFQVHQLELVSPSPSCSIILFLLQGLGIYLFFRFLLILLCGLPADPLFFFFFLFTIIRSRCLADIWGSVCVLKSLTTLCLAFSIYIVHISLVRMVKFQIFCTIHSGSFFPLLLLLFYTFKKFPFQLMLMVSQGSLCNRKSSQVSRTLLSILADLYNAVVWIFSIALLFLSPPVLVAFLWWLYQEN